MASPQGYLSSDPSRDLKGALAAKLRRGHRPHFVRSGELTRTEWSEFDMEAGIWSVPAERMKMRQAHIVPFSRQVLAILREICPLIGAGRYVFPSPRYAERPITVEMLLVCDRPDSAA